MQVSGLNNESTDVEALTAAANKELPSQFKEVDGKAVNDQSWGGYLMGCVTSPLTTTNYAQSVLDDRYEAQKKLAELGAANKLSWRSPFRFARNVLSAVFHCLTCGCFKSTPAAEATAKKDAPAA